MLSDSCYEFFFTIDQAVETLTRATLWYTSPRSTVQYGKEVTPLRMALAKLRARPNDNEARVELLRAAASVMECLNAEPVFDKAVGSAERHVISGKVRKQPSVNN